VQHVRHRGQRVDRDSPGGEVRAQVFGGQGH
jgi:hypothetical protein